MTFELRLALILGSLILLFAAAGCSRVSIAYNSADFLIERYAKDYLALERAQMVQWKPLVDKTLSRHRAEDLPYLARFFDTAYRGAADGFDARRLGCLMDQFENLYRRHMRIAIDLAAPLLSQLTPEQIVHLEQKFDEEKEKDKVDTNPTSIERRNHKRAERFGESISWWIGPLSESQIAIVREETAAIPDTAEDWIAYRSFQRETLIAMLKSKANQLEIRRFLATWLVEYQDLPPTLHQARGQIRNRIAELFQRLDASLDTKQQSFLIRRLANLRNDFLSLQRQPRMASIGCADTA